MSSPGRVEADRTDAGHRLIARAILEHDTLELLTVGIDIGSSTSHLLFARVVLHRQARDLSSRFVVVDRTVIYQSPILLTPFLPDGAIDARELSRFIRHAYDHAGVNSGDVHSGAVILTGEAIKRRNARAIDEIFARESGKFVCATAGHRLESILAAHGSGATALSRSRGACALHVDIGGGTTKLALIDRGKILSVAALAAGGRLIARDPSGSWSRMDEPATIVARELRLDTAPRALADERTRRLITRRLAELVVDQITGDPLDDLGRALQLTEPLKRSATPEYITFSGGVAEYIFGHETTDHGDIAQALSADIIEQLGARVTIPSIDPGRRIRATVIGAAQFTVQVSGKTIYLTGRGGLPVRNVPVIHLDGPLPEVIDPDAVAGAFLRAAELQDRDRAGLLALAFTWTGLPSYQRLRAMGEAIMTFAGSGTTDGEPLALVIDGDIGQTLGRILQHDLGLTRKLISIDGIEVTDLDFVDIGEFIDPPAVVPVVIKSLLFS